MPMEILGITIVAIVILAISAARAKAEIDKTINLITELKQHAKEARTQVNTLTSENRELRETLTALNTQVSMATNRVSELQQQAEESSTKIASLKTENGKLTETVTDLKTQISSATKRVSELKRQLEDGRTEIGTLMTKNCDLQETVNGLNSQVEEMNRIRKFFDQIQESIDELSKKEKELTGIIEQHQEGTDPPVNEGSSAQTQQLGPILNVVTSLFQILTQAANVLAG